MKVYTFIFAAAATFILAFTAACNPIDPDSGLRKKEIEELIKNDPDYDAKVFLHKQYMDVYYYWNEEVMDRNAKYQAYTVPDIYDWFDKLLYDKDRWSWMEDKEGYLSSETGEITGTWGVAFAQPAEYYNDYRIFIRYILPGSPLEKYGVTRGAQLISVGGCDIRDGITTTEKLDYVNEHLYDSPNKFTFKLTDGTEASFTASLASTLKTNYILKAKVFTAKDFPGLTAPVGYLNFFSFVSGFIPDLAKTLQDFKAAGVKKMILDLRYNGGGASDVSDTLVSYIAPSNSFGKTYVVRSHNNILKKEGFDEIEYVKSNKYNLDLDEIFFIMQNGSASASEMVYNGLRPLYGSKIHLVGQQTYGKPNGMYVLMYPGANEDYARYRKGDYGNLKYVFYPICFYNKNGDGEEIPSTADYGSGFIPENVRPDDVYNDFGVNESDVNACLTYIVKGAYPPIDQSHVRNMTKADNGFIVEGILPEDETNPNYGKYIVKKAPGCPENF